MCGLTFVLFGVLLKVGAESEEFHHLPLLHHGHGLTAEHIRPRTWHLVHEGTHQTSSTCIYMYKRLMNLISSAAQNHKHYGSPCVYKAWWCARQYSLLMRAQNSAALCRLVWPQQDSFFHVYLYKLTILPYRHYNKNSVQ